MAAEGVAEGLAVAVGVLVGLALGLLVAVAVVVGLGEGLAVTVCVAEGDDPKQVPCQALLGLGLRCT